MDCTIKRAKELKIQMEEDIAEILTNFELATGLKPGIVFHERLNAMYHVPGAPARKLKYKVHVPTQLK